MTEFTVRRASWENAHGILSGIRFEVFVHEQGVPRELELDAEDPGALHLLAESAQGEAIGTGRLLPDGHIGRMAVRAAWRGRGVGSLLLETLLQEARAMGLREVYLHAQTSACGFYRKAGFSPRGEEFPDAGIPHLTMIRQL